MTRYSEGDLFDYLAANGAMKETAAATLMPPVRFFQHRDFALPVSAKQKVCELLLLMFQHQAVPAVGAYPSPPLGRGSPGRES